jgi:hypothetical protein
MKSELNTLIIKAILNDSTTQISPLTLDRLRVARTMALDHQKIHRTLPVLSWIGHQDSNRELPHLSKFTSWTVAVLFAAALFGGATYWNNDSDEHEICEADVAILTDELPLHIYVD